MTKFILCFVILLNLNGCILFLGGSQTTERILWNERVLCSTRTEWYTFLPKSRSGCLKSLNTSYNGRYDYSNNLPLCQQVLSEYKTAWIKLDQQIIAESKEKNKPLPDNFKTADEIFAEYPNPCQNDDDFWKEVKKYEEKKDKK